MPGAPSTSHGSAAYPWKGGWLAFTTAPTFASIGGAGSWARIGSQWEAALQVINAGYGCAQTTANGTQNDEIGWQVPMSAGTWTITMFVRRSTNTGIVTVLIDGVSVGTYDTYNASVAIGVGVITGVTVTPDGVHDMHFKMATKNGSSAGYLFDLLAVDLTRTL